MVFMRAGIDISESEAEAFSKGQSQLVDKDRISGTTIAPK